MDFDDLEELADYIRGRGRSITAEKLGELVDWHPPYDEADAQEIIRMLGKRRPSPLLRYKQWAERNRKRIEQKEDVLWQRRSYQDDLNKLADRLDIPREGFADDSAEAAFWDRWGSIGGYDALKRELSQIVKKHSSRRLPLGEEWLWAVHRHLLRRSRPQARLMVEMMSPPQIDFDTDRRGKPTRFYATGVTSRTPDTVIRELKKDLAALERMWWLEAGRREKVSPRRSKAKKLLQKPAKEIALEEDRKLRQRYKKMIEE